MQHNYRFLFFIIIFLFSAVVFAQDDGDGNDNPNFDSYPGKFTNIVPQPMGLEAVITINGYDNFDMGTASAEPHFSMNPLNPLWSFAAYNINTAYRTTNGHDWISSVPNFGISVNGDPVTAYDSLGNLYYETMFGGITGCKVMRSTDNGATWSAAVTAIAGVDKNWIAADQTSGPYANYVYSTMTASGSVGNFSRSTNFGATWQTTATLSPQALPGMMVAVGPNVTGGTDVPGGCVYVVTHSGSNALGTYTFWLSTNGGTSFTQKSQRQFSNVIGTELSGRSTVNGMRTRPYPMIAADNSYGPFRGRLYLVYASNLPAGSGNKPDIFSRFSTDQGATWSDPVTVNDDANTVANHNFFPAIWCDKENGRLYVKFYDSRLVPSSDSMDVYATYSDDGGVTFKPNQRITNRTFKTKLSSSGSAPAYQGDYDAIMSKGSVGMLAWTDFRNNNYGSYTAYFPDYAMLANPQLVQIANNNDSDFVTVSVPSVKLYDQTVAFSATVTPTPTNGTITLDFPAGNVVSSYPGSAQLRIKTSGSVTLGSYTLRIKGEGPNGIPVHYRTVNLTVEDEIPVEFAAFTYSLDASGIRLDWQTATETNNRGFEIQRKVRVGSQIAVWETVGFIAGAGNTTETQRYTWSDNEVSKVGTYFYRLKQVDFDGSFSFSDIVEVEVTTPMQYDLGANFPNPFNPSTKIKYYLPEASFVEISVYDVLGNKISELVNENISAGAHEVSFNAGGISSGTYVYEMKAGNFVKRNKMLLVK
ncbi:MAG: T9SS type A sorting domain-containing protein [Ignavibacteriaceae bacterium]|nr:T9SS type A sorting domain-containing protein [Ignavibacteriaceae bacterium]